jgi:hypothetical protein
MFKYYQFNKSKNFCVIKETLLQYWYNVFIFEKDNIYEALMNKDQINYLCQPIKKISASQHCKLIYKCEFFESKYIGVSIQRFI